MSLPNLTNNLMQSQNIVINQVPMTHTMMTNVAPNNGMPMTSHPPMDQQQNDTSTKSGMEPMTASKSFQGGPSSSSLQDQSGQVLTKQRLQDLVRDTDSTLNLEEEVEEIILNYVDEFVDRCLNGAAIIAKNRNVNTVEVKDVQQFITRNYNMWTPGFGTDELRPYKRSLTTEAHKQRIALIRKTLKKY